MKRILLWLLVTVTSVPLMSQYCGFSGPGVCTPDTNFTGIISSYNNFTCVKRGVPFNNSFELRVPAQYTVLGGAYTVDSLKIDSLSNLPCNLCWSTDQLSTWLPGNVHCINIQGTTDDSAGLYKLTIGVTASIFTLNTLYSIPGTLDEVGAQFYVRVIEDSDVCPGVIVQPGDTSNTRLACSVTPASCPTSAPISVTPTAGTPCNYTAITYSLPAGLSNPMWFVFDGDSGSAALSLSISSTMFDGSLNSYAQVTATDSGTGCSISMGYLHPTNTGLYLEPHICIATLDSSLHHNVIVWNRDYDSYDSTITRYNLYSSIDDSLPNPSTLIGSVGYDSETIIIDTLNTPESGVIKYQLRMQDICGAEIAAYNLFAPPLLRIDTAGGIATLSWNFLDEGNLALFGSVTMRLWRSTDSINWTQISVGLSNVDTGTIYGLSLFKITDTMPVNNEVVYMVEILMPAACQPSVSRSLPVYNDIYSNRVTPGARLTQPTAVKEINRNGGLKIYPNPGNNLITVFTPDFNGTINNLTVYDITGREVLQLYQATGGNVFTPVFNVGSLAPGPYIVKMIGSGSNFSNLWVKQ